MITIHISLRAIRCIIDEEGLRTKKTATSTGVTEYILHGKNITHMTQGSHALHFYYDAQGKPGIVIYDGTAYGYLYNLQGDVVALVNGSGTKVVEYTYDAWGKPTGKTGTMAGTLGTVQPFRYRGYVYDEETGLYYLRSRYYRPEWCRFVSADALLTNHLFSYCDNCPISNADYDGFDYFIICSPILPIEVHATYDDRVTRCLTRGTHVSPYQIGSRIYEGITLDDGTTWKINKDYVVSYEPITHTDIFGIDEMQRGDHGSYVMNLQIALCVLGYYDGEIDGKFGKKTKKAVSAFRKIELGDKSGSAAGPRVKKKLFAMLYDNYDKIYEDRIKKFWDNYQK